MTDTAQSTALATIPTPDLSTLDHEELGAWAELLQERSDETVLAQGRTLAHAKATMSHGEFGAWIKRYWHKSYRTARLYMQYAQNGNALPLSEGLPLRRAAKAIAKPRKDKPAADPTLLTKQSLELMQTLQHKEAPQPPKPGEPCSLCGHVAPRAATPTSAPTKNGAEDDWQWKRQANPKPAAPSKAKTRY